MAVIQTTKGKIKPALSFQELNNHAECHTGDDIANVCNKTLHDWRQMNKAAAMNDLKLAYLQVNIAKKL